MQSSVQICPIRWSGTDDSVNRLVLPCLPVYPSTHLPVCQSSSGLQTSSHPLISTHLFPLPPSLHFYIVSILFVMFSSSLSTCLPVCLSFSVAVSILCPLSFAPNSLKEVKPRPTHNCSPLFPMLGSPCASFLLSVPLQ